ncbi:MAG: LAGLIDADG family homing endonuclease, partial [bacterium]
FLSILFTCDGSIYKRKNSCGISYSSTSKKMIDQIHILLSRFGIISRKRTKEVKSYENYLAYEIEIRDKENIELFLNEIGFKFSKKEKATKIINHLKEIKNNRGFLDCFPPGYSLDVQLEVNEFIRKNGPQNRKWWQQKPIRCLSASLKRGNKLNRNTIKEIAEIINSDTLRKDAESDIFWDQIQSIEFIGNHKTYDLTVPETHNFISGNVLVHNTWMLIELAVNAVLQGLNVVFISLEMGKVQINERFDQVIGFMTSENTQEPIEIKKKVGGSWVTVNEQVSSIYDLNEVIKNRKRIKKISGGGLKVIAFNRGRMNYMDIDRMLDDLEHTGFIADVVIWDYYGIMKETSMGQSKKERISENCIGMKEICGKRNLIGISAMQGNRKAMTAKVFHSHMVADDIDTIFNSDLVIAICQTRQEEAEGKFRLYIANYRHGKQHGAVGLIRDLNVGQIALDEWNIEQEMPNSEEEQQVGTDF